MKTSNQLVGVGLRSTHYPELENGASTRVDWFEAISENYMNTEGRPLKMLLKVRETYPVALHGVGLSIGSYDGVSKTYLQKLKKLISRVQPEIVSDHFCWSSVGGHSSHDLLPFPFTLESMNRIISNVHEVQETLGLSICLENISYYLTSKVDTFSEAQFINEVCKKTGCGLLLDLNNVDVNSQNHNFDAKDFILKIDSKYVRQLHLAGPSKEKQFVFDTHSTPVPDSVWELYKFFNGLKSDVPVIIEWDENIPSFFTLEAEVVKARQFSALQEISL